MKVKEYIQHTEHSRLAKNICEKLKVLEALGSFKMEIVERTGNTLVDTLHKSNAWADMDCMREDCIICNSDIKGGKKGSCRRRNATYETFCLTCQKKEQERLFNDILDPKDDDCKEYSQKSSEVDLDSSNISHDRPESAESTATRMSSAYETELNSYDLILTSLKCLFKDEEESDKN